MTVKEQLMLLTKGYTKAEIDALKEAEKLENQPPKDEPKDEPTEDPRDSKIKELEEDIKRLQSENVNKDVSGNNKTDTRSLFEQGVDIFKGKF